ncbi:hypothetical protein TNCV_542491 [Trichonephila clavipes]|nr:hypothetical protein TNCV_542491 [Trichonephila clavipes]
MYPWGTAVHAASTYCKSWSEVAAGGVSRANRCASMRRTFSIDDRSNRNKQAKGVIRFDGLRTLEHCMQHVVVHYPVGIWLMSSVEFMGGPYIQCSNISEM